MEQQNREWRYEDESAGWKVPVIVTVDRPDIPILQGNPDVLQQALADHRLAAVAREALEKAQAVVAAARAASGMWTPLKEPLDELEATLRSLTHTEGDQAAEEETE